jgi:hypothetical protein
MSIQQLLLGAAGASGYNLQRSVRLRSSASANLTRTPAGAGNRKTWTWSGWVKRGSLGIMSFFGASTASNAYGGIYFDSNNALTYQDRSSGVNNALLTTTQVFRDPSAWYHIVMQVDTTQATAANRLKLYVNGTQVTAFSATTYPSQNYDGFVNNNILHELGSLTGGSFFDGYMAEVNFVNAQALTPASFGSTNALTGVWQPAPYTGTYGTNGFYLKFTDNSTAAALGTDFSGNSNTWTVNNISVTAGVTYDSMTDVPTLTSATVANYAVFNPLAASSDITLSSGNLEAVRTATNVCAHSTIAVSSGKWYWEVTAGETNDLPGICSTTDNLLTIQYPGATATSYGYYGSNGQKYNNGSSTAYGATFTQNDVIGVALDLDAGTIVFYKNGVSQGTAFTSLSGQFLFSVRPRSTANAGSTTKANFGQRPFAYTPPTGFVALNTFNLPNATILKGNTVMDATLYTGNASTQTVTNAGGFRPDLVWIKARNQAYQHGLFDSVRGSTKGLVSNSTAAEVTFNSLTSFNSNGFSLNTDYNDPLAVGATYVAWQWQAGGTAVTNTAGTISAQVSANPTAGFSVVTYTGNGGSSQTVGHGLGVAPAMVIVKCRSSATDWPTHHQSFASTANNYLTLESSSSIATASNWFSKTSSTIGFPTSYASTNNNGSTYVAYCWSEIAGYSKFGSYTGNGSTDGAFVYLGFEPKFILRKGTISAGVNWSIVDGTRNPYNLVNANLFANLTNSESVPSGEVDITANGFKVRSTSFNNSGEMYIYAAFADNPFKNSLAR